MDAPPTTPKAPELPKAIQLDEDHALKVLAGTRTLTEAADLMEKKLTKAEKEKKEEVVKSMKDDKADFKKRYGKRGEEVMHATATKIAKKKTESADSEENSKDKKKNESIDVESFRSKFLSLVEAKKKEEGMKKVKGKKADEKVDEGKKSTKKKPDDDGDGVPNWADKKPGEDDNADKKKSGKKGMSDKQAKYFGKKKGVKESVFETEEEGIEDLLAAIEEEINDPGNHTDNLRDVLNATFGVDDSPEYEKARAIIERYLDLVENSDIDHPSSDPDDDEPEIRARTGSIQQHIQDYDLTDYLQHASAMLDNLGRKKNESKKMSKKKVVKESIEQKLSFRDMMKLVIESGGQQQIDPLDKELFTWATRVAQHKLGEGMKAEVYAGLVYERMGGRFEMYDVLNENKK
jgi:hypothetical protein